MSETMRRGGFSSASAYWRSWLNAASRFACLPLYSQAKQWRFHTSAQPSPPVSLRAPRSKQKVSPVGSASAGVASPSSRQRSMKCSCAAELSFSVDARHLAMNSPGLMLPRTLPTPGVDWLGAIALVPCAGPTSCRIRAPATATGFGLDVGDGHCSGRSYDHHGPSNASPSSGWGVCWNSTMALFSGRGDSTTAETQFTARSRSAAEDLHGVEGHDGGAPWSERRGAPRPVPRLGQGCGAPHRSGAFWPGARAIQTFRMRQRAFHVVFSPRAGSTRSGLCERCSVSQRLRRCLPSFGAGLGHPPPCSPSPSCPSRAVLRGGSR